jgi:hypothetical protein
VATERDVIPEPDDLIRGLQEAIEDLLRDASAEATTSRSTPA